MPTPPRSPLADSIAVVSALVVVNVAQHLLPDETLWFGVLAAAALLAHARRRGLTWDQLGLGRDTLRPGAERAAGLAAAVAGVFVLGVLVPGSRRAFLDPRYDVPVPEALAGALVRVPVRTVLVEEVAFRSVAWGMLARHHREPAVAVASSALFGLWHVLPSLRFAEARSPAAGPGRRLSVILGTVVLTALGGGVLGELRRRSGSVLPGAGLHWATNGLGLLFGLAARRLATRRQS